MKNNKNSISIFGWQQVRGTGIHTGWNEQNRNTKIKDVNVLCNMSVAQSKYSKAENN